MTSEPTNPPPSPKASKAVWWKFFGPAFIISIGYFDPGNWATDLQAGSQYGYQLLWILSLSCLIGAFAQNLCAKLGLATGRNLAEHCRDNYPRWMSNTMFVSAVISMMATDLAEIIGVAVALHLLFGIDLLAGALITAVDVFLILLLNRWGYRYIEMVFLIVLATVSGIYIAEMFMSNPNYEAVAIDSVVPGDLILHDFNALFIAIGVIGATIMPHNLYLHSSLVMQRLKDNLAPAKTLYRWSVIDTNISLFVAWFINAAILIVAAAVFHPLFLESGEIVDSFQEAYKTLVPILSQGAGLIFAVALLCAGIASSTSATLAGQIVFEGFLNIKHINLFHLRIWTRLATMAPAVIAIMMNAPPVTILVWSQVVLSLQLPFAMIPLMRITDSEKLMGADYKNKFWIKLVMWPATILILLLNIFLILQCVGVVPS